MKVHESEVIQSCPTLSDPMDCSPPGSSVHGIFQARVLDWVVIPFSRETLFWRPPKSLQMVTASMKLKDLTNLDSIFKSRDITLPKRSV